MELWWSYKEREKERKKIFETNVFVTLWTRLRLIGLLFKSLLIKQRVFLLSLSLSVVSYYDELICTKISFKENETWLEHWSSFVYQCVNEMKNQKKSTTTLMSRKRTKDVSFFFFSSNRMYRDITHKNENGQW